MPGTDRKIMPEEIETPAGPKKGLLSPIGDPLGKGLNATLSPVGAAVGGVTGPIAEGASKVTSTAMGAAGIKDRGEEKDKERQKKENRIGGKPQTGENPLGL